MPTITLPNADGALDSYALGAPRDFPKATPPFPRVALAAAHVVADPLACLSSNALRQGVVVVNGGSGPSSCEV
jgi:hypothetical protein